MYLRSLVQMWLQNAAKTRVREALTQAAREQMASSAAPPPAEEPKTCHLGVVFALGIESGCFEDLLQGVVTIRGNGFIAREGGLHGRRVVVILSRAGRENAARATEVLIDGHRPRRVVSAGFAGGLSPQLKRHDILVADRVMDITGGADIPVGPSRWGSQGRQGCLPSCDVPGRQECLPSCDVPGRQECLPSCGVHCGPLLTADRVVRLPREKQSLFRQYGALAVDMETFAVAEVCLRRQVAFSSVRVIGDAADERLPRDVEHLLAQKTGAARLGAALGAAWQRPASVKDMYQLRENALISSLRLARFLAESGFE
jgi:adenosylhomocysteine nucleosidase